MRDAPVHLIAVANGPGELSGWLLPVAARLKARAPAARVTAVLTPCQFASGRETAVAAESPGIDRAAPFWAFAREAWRSRRTAAERRDTLILQFGGDPWYGWLLARLLRVPLWRHGTAGAGRRTTERFLVPDDRIRRKLARQGVDASRITEIGQLVADSARAHRSAARVVSGAPTRGRLLLLPGSRWFEIECMVPFFVDVARAIQTRADAPAVAMSMSAYVDRARFIGLLESAGCATGSTGGTLAAVTPEGARLEILEGDWLDEAGPDDVALLLPGTATLQLAALGTPEIVVLPLNWGERIPLEGLLGLLLPVRLPFGLLKRYLTRAMNPWVRYIALPNIIASERVVPELRGVLTPAGVAAAAASLLADPPGRAAMSGRLLAIAGPEGAADRAALAILERFAAAGGGS